MSLRALKKREILNPYKKHPVPMRTRKLIDIKPNNNNNNHLNYSNSSENLIRKRCKSLPDLTINNNENLNVDDDNQNYQQNHHQINYSESSSSLLLSQIQNNNNKFISKSDTDLSKLIKNFSNDGTDLINAKSEISLKTISVHKTAAATKSPTLTNTPTSNNNLKSSSSAIRTSNPSSLNSQNLKDNLMMMNGRRNDILNNNHNNNNGSSPSSRRMSEQSHLSIYSNRSPTINDYDNHNGDHDHHHHHHGNGDGLIVDTSCVLHIPIIGYEVMEERARFTVYKLRVENPITNDCWLVLRRYTDFVRLNNKLKQSFPTINLQLPRKKLFGDNFNTIFLDNRVQGLQLFVNSIMSKDELRNSKVVRDFFCLDEPPMYSESMEECRAIFEAQEETISHLKMQINNKNDMIRSLQQRLANELIENDKLKMSLKRITSECSNCSLILSNTIPLHHSQDDDNKCD